MTIIPTSFLSPNEYLSEPYIAEDCSPLQEN